MALSINRLKGQKVVRGESSKDIMRIQKGKNFVRVFKFTHTVTQRDYDMKLYNKNLPDSPKVGEKSDELSREFWVHLQAGIAPINCFLDKKKCERCEEAREMASAGEGQAAKRMKGQKRHAINVVDMNNKADGMKRIDANNSTFEGILDEYMAKLDDGATEEEIFGCTGRDFIITYDPDAEPSNKYMVTLRDKDKSEPLPVALAATVVDYYKVTQLDPQDAPPVTETAPVETKVEAPKAASGSLPPKVVGTTAPAAVVKKTPMSRLKDEETVKTRKVGDVAHFTNGADTVKTTIASINGTKFNCKDENGDLWEVDESELLPF